MAARRYVIFGAGAVGSVIGGRLAAVGERVALVARGPHAEALKRRGLTIHRSDGTDQLKLPVGTTIDEIGYEQDDVVILSVKTHQTEAALRQIVAVVPSDAPIVCGQNGVANESMALRYLEHVYGMYTWLPAVLERPGVVVQHGNPTAGALYLGRVPHGSDQLAHELAASFARAGFTSRVDDAIMRLKYRKLIANLGNVLDAMVGEWVESPLLDAARAEAEQCFEAAGIDVMSAEEEAELDNPTVGLVPGHPWGGSSTRQSLSRGAVELETDYLNGEIVLLGRLTGVPTPVNAGLQSLARQLAVDLAAGRVVQRATLAEVEAKLERLQRSDPLDGGQSGC